MKPIRSLAFVVNSSKPGAMGLARELIAVARSMGVKLKQTSKFPLPRGYLRGRDACCVIGGDGTLLAVAEEAAREQVPVIGVNRGSLGFLTVFSAEESRTAFRGLLAGAFTVEHRAMLAVSTGGHGERLALNDVVIKDRSSARLLGLEVFADGNLVTDYLCDGLIIATATGSTAYNLSAGGPIVHPAASVVAMTPICPHTLSNRSIIFRDTVRLRVRCHTTGARLIVAADGRGEALGDASRVVSICVSRVRFALVRPRDLNYFAVVRSKLKWSGGAERRLGRS
jgi:NAD+ kinase